VWDDAPDERLVATTRAEPGAFGAFYRRHEDRVLSYFLARVGDPEVAIDLTAETFAAALASAHRIRLRRKPAAAWLFGIARNNLAMSRRRGRVEARARRRLGMAALVLTDESVERIAALDRTALSLVEELPGDGQDAVMVRVIDERDYAEIAEDLHCSEAVVAQAREPRPADAPSPLGGEATHIPDLEQELVAAAARLQSRRRLVRPAARAALAAGAVAVAAVLSVVVAADNDGDRRSRPAGAALSLSLGNGKLAYDLEAGVHFHLDGHVLTVRLLVSAPSKTTRRVGGARVRATCGRAFTEGPGPGPLADPRQTRTRLWPAGRGQVRFRFRRDISRLARWCRLEDPVVGHVAFVKFRGTGAALSPEHRIARISNKWARLFAAGDPTRCGYEIQPVCERIACERAGGEPIPNCTRPSTEFRNSFRDATVQEIAIRGDRAAAKFSNGEAIELTEDVSGLEHAGVWWWVREVGGNVGYKFFK